MRHQFRGDEKPSRQLLRRAKESGHRAPHDRTGGGRRFRKVV